MNYSANRQWSDQYIPAIKQIVGPLLLEEATFEVDTKEATDLIVLNARDKRIAARIRRAGYVNEYGFEFTLRSEVPSGCKTELQKVVDGFGDWMFYGHAERNDCPNILRWMVIDLHCLRAAMIRGQCPGKKHGNKDGTKFVAFDIRYLPIDVVISSSFNIRETDVA